MIKIPQLLLDVSEQVQVQKFNSQKAVLWNLKLLELNQLIQKWHHEKDEAQCHQVIIYFNYLFLSFFLI